MSIVRQDGLRRSSEAGRSAHQRHMVLTHPPQTIPSDAFTASEISSEGRLWLSFHHWLTCPELRVLIILPIPPTRRSPPPHGLGSQQCRGSEILLAHRAQPRVTGMRQASTWPRLPLGPLYRQDLARSCLSLGNMEGQERLFVRAFPLPTSTRKHSPEEKTGKASEPWKPILGHRLQPCA